jgi:hypothetical protein
VAGEGSARDPGITNAQHPQDMDTRELLRGRLLEMGLSGDDVRLMAEALGNSDPTSGNSVLPPSYDVVFGAHGVR